MRTAAATWRKGLVEARVPWECVGVVQGVGAALQGWMVLASARGRARGWLRLRRRRRFPMEPVLLKNVAPWGVAGRGAKCTPRSGTFDVGGGNVGPTLRDGVSGVSRGSVTSGAGMGNTLRGGSGLSGNWERADRFWLWCVLDCGLVWHKQRGHRYLGGDDGVRGGLCWGGEGCQNFGECCTGVVMAIREWRKWRTCRRGAKSL